MRTASKYWALVLAAFFFAAARLSVSAPQAEVKRDLCAIKGIVADAVTGQGLRKAFVRLIGKSGTFPAVTNEQGLFTIENIEPGTFQLEAEHQGYVEVRYSEGDGLALGITLTPGQTLSGVNIKLTPQAVISGSVVDDDGEIWTHASVSLSRAGWARGQRTLRGFTSGEVNDRGEFRIGQLPPGRYYLSADPDTNWEARNNSQTKGPQLRRQPTWYPNSLDMDGATPITVGPGSQISGLQIRLRRGSTHRIRGTLLGRENIPASVQNGPFDRQSISANGKNGAIHSDGSFEIAGLAPGSYEVRVRQGFPPINLGSVKVEVADRDLEDVALQLVAPRPIKGVIQVEEKDSMKPGAIRVELSSLIPGWPFTTLSRADGSFEFPLLGSEKYRVFLSGAGFYLKQIRYGDTESSDGTISLTGEGGSLTLLISTRGARLTGKVTRTAVNERTNTAPSPQVVLIPKGVSGQTRVGVVDQEGTFSYQDLPPGAYKLYAFEGVPVGAWEDAEFLQELSPAGIEIQLAAGDVRTADVPLLTKLDLAPALKKLGAE